MPERSAEKTRNCTICIVPEIEYKSIWVDKCAVCEGIWLDAGELESVSQLDKKGLDRLFGVFRKQG